MRSAGFRLLVIAVVVITGLIGAQVASAKPKPIVNWTSPRSASAGSPISVSWTSKHLPTGAKLVVQKPVGTAHVFKTVIRLGGPRGTAQLPAQGTLGKYRYRLAALIGKTVVAEQPVTVAVFGQVPFSIAVPHRDEEGVYTTPTTSFTYVRFKIVPVFGAGEPTQPSPVFSVTNNDCVAVHVDFIFAKLDMASGSFPFYIPIVGTVSILQERQGAVSAMAGYEVQGELDAALTPGQSWSLSAFGTKPVGNPIGNYDVLLNGYATCDSAEPLS